MEMAKTWVKRSGPIMPLMERMLFDGALELALGGGVDPARH